MASIDNFFNELLHGDDFSVSDIFMELLHEREALLSRRGQQNIFQNQFSRSDIFIDLSHEPEEPLPRRGQHNVFQNFEIEDQNPSRTSENLQEKFPVFEFSGHGEPQCIVCYGDFQIGENLKALSCLHKFHVSCIDPWLQVNHKCPVCKYDLKENIDISKL